MTGTFEVVAESSRRRILDCLHLGERPVNDLAEELSMAQPAVSKHLRVLRHGGLVVVRPEAQRRLYRLRPEPLVGRCMGAAGTGRYHVCLDHLVELLALGSAPPLVDAETGPWEQQYRAVVAGAG